MTDIAKPTITDEMIDAGIAAYHDHAHDLNGDRFHAIYTAMIASAPQEPDDADKWNPRNEDPFWMLEAEDGEWLKNERTMSGTRDVTKALRFPTESECYNHPARMTPGYKWWSAKPTEHSWVGAEGIAAMHSTVPQEPVADDDAVWLRKIAVQGVSNEFSDGAKDRLERIADRLQAKAPETGEG